MKLTTELAITLVAMMHGLFLVLEIFLWRSDTGCRQSGLSKQMAAKTSELAANQGLYNSFLASGLIWSLYVTDFAFELRVFFCAVLLLPVCFARLPPTE
jgi:putative membrane protein